ARRTDSRWPSPCDIVIQCSHAGLRDQRSEKYSGDRERRSSGATRSLGGRSVTLAAIVVFAATCNIAPVLSDQFRSSILDLAVDGNDLWAATSYGVAVYDRSVDPPRLVAAVAVPGTTHLLRLGNGVAYAGSGNSLAVLLKNGRALQLIRTVDAGAPVNDIAVTTLALFVATRNGLAQYGLTDPTNPSAPIQITQ